MKSELSREDLTFFSPQAVRQDDKIRDKHKEKHGPSAFSPFTPPQMHAATAGLKTEADQYTNPRSASNKEGIRVLNKSVSEANMFSLFGKT